MGLLKKKLTGEDVLEALKNLSREELIAIKEALAGYGEENTAENSEESAKEEAAIEDSATAAEENSEANDAGEDDSANAVEEGDNSSEETEAGAGQDENASAEENGTEGENSSDFDSRIKSLEELVQKLFARLEAEAGDSSKEAEDNAEDHEVDSFGLPASGESADEEKSSKAVLEETRKKYFGF